MVSKLIQQYEARSGSYSGLIDHLNTLASIGEEFVEPNSILPEDLNRLAKALGNLLKLLKKQNAKKENIDVIKRISAKISSIATKKLSKRTPEINQYLLDLGDQLADLKIQLGCLLGPGILITFLECLH